VFYNSDCPSSVNITASAGWSFKEGDVLRCVSDGYPEPSYTWTDDDGVVVSTASTTRLSEGVFNLTCTVTGSFTTPCSASNSITGNATGKTLQFVVCTLATMSSYNTTQNVSHYHWILCIQRKVHPYYLSLGPFHGAIAVPSVTSSSLSSLAS